MITPNVPTPPKGPRTYGNWRKPTSAGLGKLSGAATVTLFVGLVATVLTQAMIGLLYAVAVLAFFGLVILGLMFRDRDGLTIVDRIGERMMFMKARRKKTNIYRAGTTGKTPLGSCQLPGIASQLRAMEYEDSLMRTFVVVESRSTFALVFHASPDGQALVDEETIDTWVSRFGFWLATLGQEADLAGAQVVIDSAPDTGSRLRQEIQTRMKDDAPDLAREVMNEVQTAYPTGAANLRVFITLTYRKAGRTRDEFGRQMQTRLANLTGNLAGTGAGVVHPCSLFDLAQFVRTSYDPAAGELFDEAVIRGQSIDLEWNDVGPIGAEAQWDYYTHDSGVSVTWAMTCAPKGIVQSHVLNALLAPHARIARKRVALMYRPVDVSKTADVAEADLNQALARANNQSRPTARAQIEIAQAQKTAQEEASGAGLVNFGVVVSATGSSRAELDQIRSTVTALAASSRLRIRPVYGAQDAGFAISLPLGLIPVQHAAVASMMAGKM